MFFKKKTLPDNVIREKVIKHLFPPLVTLTDKEQRIFHIDYGIDSNLESVLGDLEEGKNDEVTRKNIQHIIKRLIDLRVELNIMPMINKKAKYIIIDTLEDSEDLSKIEAAKEEGNIYDD